MKRLFKWVVVLLLLPFSGYLEAQDIVWRDTFRQYVAPTSAQIAKWNSFRAKLLSTYQYSGMKITGSYDATGKICTDATIAKDFAAALRTYTTYISGTTGGNVWSLCNRYDGEVWLNPPSSCSGSNCPSPGYIIRPGIGTGNSNWGGVNTATCGGNDQWMEFRFIIIPPYNKDMGTLGVEEIDKCTYKQDIKAKFRNYGKQALDSFQYTVHVNATTYGPYWSKTKLTSQQETTLTVLSGYTFNASTNYTIKVITSKPDNFKDSFAGNDSGITQFFFNGSKGIPNAIDTLVCGSQSVTLRAVPNAPGDSLAWFSDRALTQLVGRGNKYTTKYLASGAKYKFYVSSYNGFNKSRLLLDYSYVNYWPGNMFDFKALVGDVFMDSMGLNIYSVLHAVGTDVPLEVWIREGSYTDPGATTTSSMWTRVYNGTVKSKGSQVRSSFPISYAFTKGKSYGVYVQIPNGGLLFNPASRTVSNGEVEIRTGTANQTNFGTALGNYDFDGEIFYRYLLCVSPSDSSTLDVKPTPFGARLEPGLPFQTSPKKSGTGTKASPHVVALGDTLALNLKSPTNFADQFHSSTWKVASVTMETSGGSPLSNFGWTDPDALLKIPGRLVYSPAATEIDKVVLVKMRIQEIGGNNCDTFLTHYIYIAPLPEPDFTRATKICDGDAVEFTNKSDIASGFLEYKWYFGTGDSSEAMDPIYQYPKFGTYYCKLNAISSIYGYVRSKTDTIVVTQIPNIAFTVQNACETKTHSFINKSTVSGGTLSYVWDFGDGTAQSFLKDPSHKYANVGQYKVTLTASANGCQSALTKNAYVFPKPVANFTFPSSGIKYCTNTPVPFQSTSTILSGNMGVLWSFELGEIGTVSKPMHTFDKPGNYTIKLTAISEFGCMDSIKKPLTIFEAPKVSFTNGQVCDQTPTIFTNNTQSVAGTTSNTKWSFGDGATSTANSPTHQYTLLGPKVVKLLVTLDNGCSDSFMSNISVGTQAVVDFDMDNTCSGKEVQFENKTTFKQGDIKYKWLFGGVDSTTITDPKYTFNVTNSTTYNITLIATVNEGCVSSLTKAMTVFELPVCGFTVTDVWGPGEGYRSVQVEAADKTLPFYRYKFSDGGSLTTATGIYQFPYEGDFTITLVTRNSVDCECSSIQSKSIRNSLSSSSVKGEEIRLFPNPSTGLVNVESKTGSVIEGIEVYNVLGEHVTVGSSVNGSKGVVEFGDASNGIYLVKVTTATGSVTRRITINK